MVAGLPINVSSMTVSREVLVPHLAADVTGGGRYASIRTRMDPCASTVSDEQRPCATDRVAGAMIATNRF